MDEPEDESPGDHSVAADDLVAVAVLTGASRYWERCEVSDNCLECPLSRCKYDDPAVVHPASYRRPRRTGCTCSATFGAGLFKEVMAHCGISAQSVYRSKGRAEDSDLSGEDLEIFAAIASRRWDSGLSAQAIGWLAGCGAATS